MRWTDAQLHELATSMGLDPFPTEFHTVPAHVLHDVAARGIPGRYSHWSHGKEFWHGITRHKHGMGRIYELVINSNPSQAYLLDVNSDVINLMVKVHVLGHTDFFKHNRAFTETSRDMPERSALRAERIRGYEELHGIDTVEQFIDAALPLQWYVDPHKSYSPKIEDELELAPSLYDDILNIGKPHATPPTDSYEEKQRFSGLPTRDILGFLIAKAPLDDWQRDILEIVREDGLYFWPQIRTKVANEGWASLWHQKMMHALDLTDGEYMEYAAVNAGVVSAHPGTLNPYWLGLKILQDIERRLGRDKLFEARRLETDTGLIRNYLTQELVEDLQLVRYGPEGEYYVVTETEWERVRDAIANDLAGRFPEIEVIDSDGGGRSGALVLEHKHDGRDLKTDTAKKVLNLLKNIWRKPVYLHTKTGTTAVSLASD